ncbi:MAG: phage major capsid protein [Actinobacteria bacterium]|nr:phage major capsid protein [Actinomycetota bacterium]MBE3114595.1 phage major capsid protein [Actinomycetota bacterium]
MTKDKKEFTIEKMSPLQSLLTFGKAGNAEKKGMLNKEWFKKSIEGRTCSIPFQFKTYGLNSPYERIDGYKALLQSENQAITDSTLVQEEVYRTVIEGTEPFKCWRQLCPTTTAESYQTRILKGELGTYADEVAEAGAIPIDTQTYTTINIPIKKYGVRPVITNELIADSLFDIVEMELRKAGARLENKLNRVVLDKILNGDYKIATSTLNPAGAHIAVSDIALAAKKVKKQNIMPDTMVTHPTAEGYLLQDSNLAYVAYAGNPSPLTLGVVPKLMGLTPYTCTATDKAGPTWNDSVAGTDVHAIVFSKNDLAMLRMRQDITITEYDDPIHDLVGMSCLMRYGAEVLNEKAGCVIYYK